MGEWEHSYILYLRLNFKLFPLKIFSKLFSLVSVLHIVLIHISADIFLSTKDYEKARLYFLLSKKNI